ncbi:MAG: hypothetical protein HYT87_17745 [Nitrospirae bacterium]|nr:hypothetical protein [Nitrospirota bacterium]
MFVLLVCAALLAAAFFWVARPVLTGRDALEKVAPMESENWQLNAVLQQIREIELDFHAGRLSAADYEGLRKHYESRAGELLEGSSK